MPNTDFSRFPCVKEDACLVLGAVMRDRIPEAIIPGLQAAPRAWGCALALARAGKAHAGDTPITAACLC